jgi:CMP-N-acetylneuraminic acid synthetase
MPSIIALVPMRHHSQRVPGKNYRSLAGKPLFHHILGTVLAVPEIAGIAVDTDSATVMEGLRSHFPEVIIIERPAHLRGDAVSMNLVLEHDTATVPADFYLQTHATNPLLRSETLSKAIRAFLDRYPDNDSLFSVTRVQSRLYDQAGKALNHNPAELIQTQELPPVFQENSCLYLFTRSGLTSQHHRIGPHPYMFEVPAAEAWDIDDELAFEVCDCLMQRRNSLADRPE